MLSIVVIVRHFNLVRTLFEVFAEALRLGHETLVQEITLTYYGVAEPLHIGPASAIDALHHSFIFLGHCYLLNDKI